MDLSKLTPGDYVLGGGALLFLIALLLPWYGLGGYSENGLDYFFFGIIPLLLILAVVILAALEQLTDVALPDLPVPWTLAYVGLAGFATLLVLVKILIGDDLGAGGGVFGEAFSVELDRKVGIFVAFLAAAGVTAGAVIKLLQEGDLDRLTGKPGSGPYPPNPPQGGPYGGPPAGGPGGPQPF